jgi:hypothetical protein
MARSSERETRHCMRKERSLGCRHAVVVLCYASGSDCAMRVWMRKISLQRPTKMHWAEILGTGIARARRSRKGVAAWAWGC